MFKRLPVLSLFLLASVSAGAQGGTDTTARIQALLKQMTREEKVAMIHASSPFTTGGVPRLKIPEITMSDGPHGVRPEFGRDWELDKNVADSGTYLPTGVCLASTWNPELGYAFGGVLGREAAFRGKNIILGPGVNIIRTPLNGRNFEYQSEDPFLASRMAVGYIRGVQDQGISACVKHFAANNQETRRFTINVEMSERALREIYLPAFKAAIQEGGAHTVMAAYNKFRGQWASQNNYLLNQILKKEWGFRGFVMSDWDAVHSSMQALWNGMDVEMGTDLRMLPNPDYRKFFMADTVLTLIRKGQYPEYLLDEKVSRILYVMIRNGMLDGRAPKKAYNAPDHQQTALKIASEGIVLLKNDNGFLPIRRDRVKKIAVIGYNADRLQALGGGSSQVKAFYEVTPLEGLRKGAGKNLSIRYAKGYNIARGAKADPVLIAEAVALARQSDVVVFVGGGTHGYDYNVWDDNAYDAEATDKPDMHLPFGQDELLEAVLKVNPKTVVVLMSGGALDMRKWLAQTPAVLQAWYPGMEGGNAIAGILFGSINPSGKLPMTFPQKLEDHGAHALGQYPGDEVNVYYQDDIYVGYRYYDTHGVTPQFAFGHGLSYTSFAYSDLTVQKSGRNVRVQFAVRNTGKLPGAEVAQVYVSQQESVLPRPAKELKGFQKVHLQPGEQKTVTLELGEEAFQYFDDRTNQWRFDGGLFTIRVGSSSRDIRMEGSVRF
jgi:beta-glucosidase